MKTNTRIKAAAEQLSNAFIQFSLALRDEGVSAVPSKQSARKTASKPVQARVKRAVASKRVVKVVGKRASKKAALASSKAQMKPCPVTGILNTHRRFSYLMPEVRTAANLKKFKGWASKGAIAPAATVEAAPPATAS